MAFDQVLVEGFQVKPLRKLLEPKGRKAEANWASLPVVAELPVVSGKTVDEARALLTPQSRLHALRSILNAQQLRRREGQGREASARGAWDAARAF